MLNVNDINNVPITTRFNIASRGITIISKKEIPKFDFKKAISQKETKIESDIRILKIVGFPESVAFLGMILLNIGYLLLL